MVDKSCGLCGGTMRGKRPHARFCSKICRGRRRPDNRDRERARDRRRNAANPEKTMLKWARQRARLFGLPFTITPEDIAIPERCPALGINLERGARGRAASPSLDRIFPELGYIPGNVVVVSFAANRIKSNASPEELVRVASFYSHLAAAHTS
jgi:hypothetical protein